MKGLLAAVPGRLFFVTMLIGSAVITASSIAYFDFDTLPPFVIEKLPVRFEALWLASLRFHVASAALAFPLCLVSMTRWLQRRAKWHRWIGRIAGTLVLFVLVPSGVVLSFDAKGGGIVTAGFLLSAAIVAWGAVHGTLAARRRDFVAHRRAMRHVIAQMSVAVTSRSLILGLDACGVDPGVAYAVALWAPVLASAAVAELVSHGTNFFTRSRIQPIGGLLRDVSPLSPLVRPRVVVRPVARPGR